MQILYTNVYFQGYLVMIAYIILMSPPLNQSQTQTNPVTFNLYHFKTLHHPTIITSIPPADLFNKISVDSVNEPKIIS